MFELNNISLKYDILDDLEARESNSIAKITDEIDSPVLSPREFYNQFFLNGCTHLFTVGAIYNEENKFSIDRAKEMYTLARNRYFGDCGLDVQSVRAFTSYSLWHRILNQMDSESLIDDTYDGFPCLVIFKIPVKIDYNATSRRIVLNALNFLATCHSIMLNYSDYEVTEMHMFLAVSLEHDGRPVHTTTEGETVDTKNPYMIKFNSNWWNHQTVFNMYKNAMSVQLRNLLSCGIDTIETLRIIEEWYNKYKREEITEDDV